MSANKDIYLTELKKLIVSDTERISILQTEITKINEKIKNTERKLWDNCNHQWLRDYTAPFDDLCKYYCKKCLLWRDRSMYK